MVLMLLSLAPLASGQSPARQAQEPSTSPLPAGLSIRRLILKDGSYQVVEKLEVRGDRVRYLSAERYEWEEVPASLVDWAATEKYAREGGKPETSPEAREIDAEEQAERQKEEARSPLVAPGLRLPDTGGVFLLDVYQGEAQLNELTQNGSEIKRNTGGNILRSTVNPLAGQKESIELKGQHARIQAHVKNPFFYFNVAPEADAGGGPRKDSGCNGRFRIVRAEAIPKKDVRVVGKVNVAIYGKVSQQEQWISTKCETVTSQAGADSWTKLTPEEPMEPGEYAVVEMLENNQMNLYVWDFGVNLKAPPNAGAWFGGQP